MAQSYDVLCHEVVITAGSNDVIACTGSVIGAGTATITPGAYYLHGDGTVSGDLCKAIKDALDTEYTPTTFTVAYAGKTTTAGVTGTVTITPSSGTIQLLDASAQSSFDLQLIGHANGANTATSTPLVSTLSPSATWVADQPRVLIDQAHFDRPGIHQHRTPAGQRHTFASSSPAEARQIAWEHVYKDRVLVEHSSADVYRTFANFWETIGDGRTVRLYADVEASAGTLATLAAADLVGTYVIDAGDAVAWNPSRTVPAAGLFGWQILLWEYVA
jgi:hypothetical protein